MLDSKVVEQIKSGCSIVIRVSNEQELITLLNELDHLRLRWRSDENLSHIPCELDTIRAIDINLFSGRKLPLSRRCVGYCRTPFADYSFSCIDYMYMFNKICTNDKVNQLINYLRKELL